MTVFILTMAILLTVCTEAMGQVPFWQSSATPGTPAVTSDTAPVTLGLRFYSEVPGSITGVRFYKGLGNTGTHVGNLWSSTGTNLASVTFSGETASGWQQANFSSPVSIAANTTYVVSYFAPQGHYALDRWYDWNSLDRAPLHVSGSSPGVYDYGSAPTFPDSTTGGSNYWVDLLFVPGGSGAPIPPSTYSISGRVTGSAASVTLSGAASRSTTTDGNGNYSFSGLPNGSYVVTPNQSGYTFTPPTGIVSINGASVTSMNFTAASQTSYSFWPNTTTPGLAAVTGIASVTIGLRFSSDVAGSVTGVRFYKGLGNTGTHIGNLWSSAGANLASVTFSGETVSGWQQANFSSPVNIAANTTYVISYFAPAGHHAHDQWYEWNSLDRAPLQVSGVSPGVFAYGSGAVFPYNTWNGSNYWVQPVFVPGTAPNPSSTYSISGRVTGSAASVSLAGAAVRVTSTDGSGNYNFSGLPNGAYVVTPVQLGYTFAPLTALVSIGGASIAGVNFTGTAVPLPIPIPHSVSLSWTPSTSSNLRGYNVYRATVSGGPYARLNALPVTATSYLDNNVAAGQTYFYVATAVDSEQDESSYSNQAIAPVPTP